MQEPDRLPGLEAITQRIEARGVATRLMFGGNVTRQPFYRNYADSVLPLPNSDTIHANGFYFGNNPELTESELHALAGLLVG
jgi:CDP-6-deoxy-D-xylo-4-hexulose-3-dehydrase